MAGFPPNTSGRQRRPLPDIQPARTSLPSSSSVASGTTSSKASSISSSSVSGGGHLPSKGGPSPAALCPRYAASLSRPPRTKLTPVACETCRRRRTKCSGDRPKCAACVGNQLECTYQSLSSAETNSQALKRRLKEMEDEKHDFKELYQYLNTGPESQVYEIIRRIRMRADVDSIVKQIQDGDPLLQVSLVPETTLRFEFPYRTEMPAAIQRSNNEFLRSVMYEAVCAEDRLPPEGQDERQQHRRQDELDALAKRYPPEYLRPYHAAKLVDLRLEMADVTRWTQVITENKLFVSILSAYLLQEYPGFPVFHKDTFLQALVDGDRRFCSPLLVNALMAEACHCYSGVPNHPRYWDPLSLGYRFLAEATRLWELQAGPRTIVQMQAATLLYLVYAHNGLDQLGLPFLAAAVEIGHELGVFDASESAYPAEPELANARLFTAWTVFRHTTIAGFHFKRVGLMKSAPQAPLPSPDERPNLYGDLQLQYPLHEGLSSTNYGHLFREVSMLRVILNDIAAVAFNGGRLSSLPADRWLDFRDQLENWYLGLPVPLLPKSIIWPAQFAMHMEYNITLVTLSRICISADTIDGPTANNSLVNSARRAAAEILPLAIVNLETVIRLHYVRHSFEYYEGHLTGFLMTMCNLALESRVAGSADSLEPDAREHLRSTLILCLKGLADQGKHVHIAAVICRLLLDRQIPEDLNLLGAHIGMDILEDRSVLGHPVYSAYPLETGTMNDVDSSRLENLLRENNLNVR